MRGNVEERKAVAARIETLVNMLKTMITDAESYMNNTAGPGEQIVVREKMSASQVDGRVTELIRCAAMMDCRRAGQHFP